MAVVKVDLVEFRCWTQACNHFVIDWCRHWTYIFQNLLDFLVQFSFCLLVFVGLIVEDVELRLAIVLLLMHALDKKGFQNLLDFFITLQLLLAFVFVRLNSGRHLCCDWCRRWRRWISRVGQAAAVPGKKEKCSRLMTLSGGENYRVRNISMCTK